MNEELIGRVGRHLRSWVTGRPPLGDTAGPGVATVVLEDPGHLTAVLGSDVVGPRTLVLVPGEQDGEEHASGATVIGYEGSLSEPGDDASVGDVLFLQVQDYSTSPYMSLLGTTLVRVAGETDFETFLADADTAKTEGTFAAFAVSPAVQLADLPALGGREPGDGPGTRLYVNREGDVSISPQGVRLGTAGDSAAALGAEWDRLNSESPADGSVALGAALPEEVRGPAVRQRPWLARYLAALDVQRDLQGHGVTDARVSGFGRRLVPALDAVTDAHDAVDPGAPFLSWTPEKAYVRVPGLDRTFQLGRRAAQITEMLLVHGSVEGVLDQPAQPDTQPDTPPVDRAAVDQVLAFFAAKGVPLVPDTSAVAVTA
ncbi:daptide biosynthesis RiPP recognition protein [Streptomyces sp. NBC_00370]|uniref:daptide biosynthesis RiPP recognition protein n=1 Tax=Streptomyces sp. NBC_00370 TaxID=2975728 RepID=UPI002E26D8BF